MSEDTNAVGGPRDQAMAAHLGAMLAQCQAKGMRAPYILILASANGSIAAFRKHVGDEPSDSLVEHGGALVTPISGLVIDQDGGSVPFRFDAGDVAA